MATTIHSLAYKVTMDSKGFTAGSIATQKELRAAKQVTDQYRTATDHLQDKISGLATLQRKGLITQSQYNDQVKKMTAASRQAAAESSKLGKAVGRVGTAFKVAGAAAVAGALYATVSGVKKQFEEMDKAAKLADRLNINVEDLIRIQHGASLTTNATMEVTAKAMQDLNKRVQEAKRGTGEGVYAFERLQLSADQLSMMPISEQLKKVADALQTLDESARLELTEKVFGEGGVQLMNLLNQGSAGIGRMADEADRLGIVFSRTDAAKIEQANDALNKMHKSFSAMTQELAVTFAPLLAQAAENLRFVLSGGKVNVNLNQQATAEGAVGMLNARQTDILSQYQDYRNRYTGQQTPLSERETRAIATGGASATDYEGQASVANEMLKELRRLRGIAEEDALTFDARTFAPKELE